MGASPPLPGPRFERDSTPVCRLPVRFRTQTGARHRQSSGSDVASVDSDVIRVPPGCSAQAERLAGLIAARGRLALIAQALPSG